MKFINFLFHLYQPPCQRCETVKKIADESYLPLTRQVLRFPDLKFTININYCLLEHLKKICPAVIDNLKRAYDQGNLELTNSGAYHPLFPLLPEHEIIKQLRSNEIESKKIFNFRLNSTAMLEGIFPPEMAFTPSMIKTFKALGYKWTIADDYSFKYYNIEVPYNKIYTCEGMAVFLRSNLWSNKLARPERLPIVGKEFVDHIITGMSDWMGVENGYLVISLDGETFGHHIPVLGERFLMELFAAFRDARDDVELAHVSDIYDRFPKIPQFVPPSSWSMDDASIADRDYFSWWKSPQNEIHKLQWDLTYFVLSKVRISDDLAINKAMDKALFSCPYWWATIWNFDPIMIYNGAFEMMRILQWVAYNLDYKEWCEEAEPILRQLVQKVEERVAGAAD